MSLRYKDDIMRDDPTWIDPESGSYTNKQLEGYYCWKGCWPNSKQSCQWVENTFIKLLKENPNYKPERFSQREINCIRKKWCI